MNSSVTSGRKISGFKIDFLEKISNTKGTKDTKMTMTHYVAKIAKQKDETLLKLRSDLLHVPEARYISNYSNSWFLYILYPILIFKIESHSFKK